MNQLPVGTILFDGVSKRYRLGELGSLRGALGALARRRQNGEGPRDLWALKDVSFRVEPGDSLGLIGPNGAGKTTTLKLLSRITQPTSGQVRVSGRTSSLIELGAGFHPELTGRENIFLNGAILGLKRHEITRKLDAIVAFSGMERFVDTPVKRYSSGMYVRLGFAVAAHVEPEIMLIDEVLAVGDSEFRQKCLARVEELRRSGTTIVFVSHNMYLVQRLCERTILLADGQAQFLGDTKQAISTYEAFVRLRERRNGDHPLPAEEQRPEAIFLPSIDLFNSEGHPISILRHDDTLSIRATYAAAQPVRAPIIKVRLVRADGTVCAMAASAYQQIEWTLAEKGTIHVQFAPVQLVSGRYAAEVRIIDETDNLVLGSGQSDWFTVQSPGFVHEVDRGTFVPNVRWSHMPSPDLAFVAPAELEAEP